jgi:uncharacterized membrane protein YdbT with pleckstrin-like domain
MGFIDDSLIPGEKALYRTKPHWVIFITPVIMLFLLMYIGFNIDPILGTLAFLFSLYIVIRLLSVFISTEFALTNKRVIAKTGLIRRHSLEIMLTKVESISISQSINGRLWNFGTVNVVGSGGTNQALPMIRKPMELRQRVNTQISTLSDRQIAPSVSPI